MLQVSGGEVTDACASVAGNALCFNGAGARVAATAPISTISGGVLRFALRMGSEDHGLAADVVLEYKPIGHGWVQLQRYSHGRCVCVRVSVCVCVWLFFSVAREAERRGCC